jgi:FMN reductase
MNQLARPQSANRRLHIVGLGGTTRPGSSSEQALLIAMAKAADLGATTKVFGGQELATLPHYSPAAPVSSPVSADLVDHLRRADGVIIASPGYHGCLSGLIKNALDYIEELSQDQPAYLGNRAVGLIAAAQGWQAAVTTLTALRAIAHALRGWVTPLGASINSAESHFSAGVCDEAAVTLKLELVASEVFWFADVTRTGVGDVE